MPATRSSGKNKSESTPIPDRKTSTTRKKSRQSKIPFAPHADIPHNLDTNIQYPSLASPRLCYSYAIARGEQGVLTFEPYKSTLLPYWRFRTAEIAQESADTLYRKFQDYGEAGDFVGMDMARKFIQMGMTRAKRYANYAGGRKYDRQKGVSGVEGRLSNQPKEKSEGHEGQDEKAHASEIFKAVWKNCKEDERYAALREKWCEEKKVWDALPKTEKDARDAAARKS